jgi:hypothetical protein
VSGWQGVNWPRNRSEGRSRDREGGRKGWDGESSPTSAAGLKVKLVHRQKTAIASRGENVGGRHRQAGGRCHCEPRTLPQTHADRDAFTHNGLLFSGAWWHTGHTGHTAWSAALARVPLDPEMIRGCAKPFEPQVQHACHGSRKQGKFVKSGSSAPSPRNASVVSMVAYSTLVTITNYGNPLVICGRDKV